MGWNYRADSPTYRTYTIAELGSIKVTSVSFADEGFSINHKDMNPQEAEKVLGFDVIRSLLDPGLNTKIMYDGFRNQVDSMESDGDEPDYPEYDD